MKPDAAIAVRSMPVASAPWIAGTVLRVGE